MNIADMMMDLMEKYEWMPASIARFLIDHDIDIHAIPEMMQF